LSFCKQLARLHGGTIELLSKEGEGSTFTLIIPFLLVDENQILPRVKSNPAVLFGKLNDESNPKFEVLIVDDTVTNYKILSSLLRRKSLRPSIAENGKVAVDLVLADVGRFALIFMDNVMPVMNGLEATKALRLGGYLGYIAGLTGNMFEDDVDQFISAGVDIVLSKPLKIDELDKVIDSVNAKNQIGNQSTTSLEDGSIIMKVNSFVNSVTLEHVLIVDDVHLNCKMLSKLLSSKGLKSDTACNGQVAIDMVVNDLEKYKLIFMDNLMPVLNGLDATRLIRRAGFKYLIIGLTGNVFEDDTSDFLAAGVDAVLYKPLKVELIDKLLLKWKDKGYISSAAKKEIS
jgi:CheY-like chemotaxis protein